MTPKVKGRILLHIQHWLCAVWHFATVYWVAEALSATMGVLISNTKCFWSRTSQRNRWPDEQIQKKYLHPYSLKDSFWLPGCLQEQCGWWGGEHIVFSRVALQVFKGWHGTGGCALFHWACTCCHGDHLVAKVLRIIRREQPSLFWLSGLMFFSSIQTLLLRLAG